MKKNLIFGLYFLIFVLVCPASSPDDWELMMSSAHYADSEDADSAGLDSVNSDSINSEDDVFYDDADDDDDNYLLPLPAEVVETPQTYPRETYPVEPPSSELFPVMPLSREAAPAASPPPPPPSPAPKSTPSSHPAKPQPPVRTVVPMVNIIIPPAAPSAAAPSAAASPPASERTISERAINVTPQLPGPNSMSIYRVQLGAFSNTGFAKQCYDRLQAAGFSPTYEQYGSLYRVVIVGIKAADVALVVQRLQDAGFTDVWIREEK